MTPATVQRLRPVPPVPDQLDLFSAEDEPTTTTEDTDSTTDTEESHR